MNVVDFSITILFNQKGIDKKIATQIESLIFFKNFLKQNFPDLLNNLSKGGYNSIEFDNYRVAFGLEGKQITIGLIDCKKINTLQENNIYLLLDKILNYLNDVADGRINDYIEGLRLNFIFQRIEDNVNDILNNMLSVGNINELSNVIIALTSFIPHKTQLVFYKKNDSIYSCLECKVEQLIDINGKDIGNIKNNKDKIIKYINGLVNYAG